MPKQKYIIRDFSGGMNTKRDPRDLAENESSLIVNMSIDAIGKIRTSGGMYPHIRSFNAAGNISEYIPDASVNLAHTTPGSGGGYSAFYFESDHNLGNLVITDTKHPGTGNDLTKLIQNQMVQLMFHLMTLSNYGCTTIAIYETKRRRKFV